MNWPQIAAALLLACNATVWIYCFAVADDLSDRGRIVAILAVLMLTAATVGALSAGGFW